MRNIINKKYTRIQLAKELQRAFSFLPLVYKIKSICRPVVSPMHKLLEIIPENRKIFDIGCGTGALLHLALKYRRAKYAYGYDISEKNICYSSHKLWGKEKFLIEYTQKMPELKGFDLITMTDVIHHIPKIEQNIFLKSVIDKLDDESLFIIMDIDASDHIGRSMNHLHDLIISKQHVHPRKRADIIEILTDYGLEIIHIETNRSLWYFHYLIVGKKINGSLP